MMFSCSEDKVQTPWQGTQDPLSLMPISSSTLFLSSLYLLPSLFPLLLPSSPSSYPSHVQFCMLPHFLLTLSLWKHTLEIVHLLPWHCTWPHNLKGWGICFILTHNKNLKNTRSVNEHISDLLMFWFQCSVMDNIWHWFLGTRPYF